MSEEIPVTTGKWVSLFFDQDDKASRILDVMCRFDGHVTYRGATDKSVKRALAMLRKEVGEVEPTLPIYDGISWGASDATIEVDEYVIAYNLGLGYVSLSRRVR